jgi:spermidine synthase
MRSDIFFLPCTFGVNACHDRTGIARSIASREFLEHARCVVGRDGVFVINLAEYESNVERMLEMVREVFGGPVFSVRVGWGGNTVLFAGGALGDVRCLELVASRARDVEARLDLRFSRIPRLVDELLGRSAPG